MEDSALLIVRIALAMVVTSAGWIVVSLMVDVVRLLRGKVTTRTFMGVVARYLVVGAAVTPTVTTGGAARAAECDTSTDDSPSPFWITPVVSSVTAFGVVVGREKLRRRDDDKTTSARETCDDGSDADHLILESEVPVPNCVPPHEFVVGVLGPVNVTTADGDRVKFARSRSEELVVWLALHPSKRFRSMARADMWAEPVKDSTFANITSDARKAVQSCDGVSSLGVTLNDELSLTGVVSDLEILRRCVNHARRWPDDGGTDALRFGLSLVRGTPFSGVSYIWSDSTGLATEAVMLVVRAATMLADMCSDADDTDGVYWATGQGLLAVPGQEDLLAVRLRLHAERQDRASLVAEWNAYLRMLAGDPWSDGHPSSTMAEVWRELTA